jgi:hypothetical protein
MLFTKKLRARVKSGEVTASVRIWKTPGARLTLHQDKDESDFSAPIVSVSLGLSAVFLFGGHARKDKQRRMPLQHGDVVVWWRRAAQSPRRVAVERWTSSGFRRATSQPHFSPRALTACSAYHRGLPAISHCRSQPTQFASVRGYTAGWVPVQSDSLST